MKQRVPGVMALLAVALAWCCGASAAPADDPQAALARRDYGAAAAGMSALMRRADPTPIEREAIYTWLTARDDQDEIDRRTKAAVTARHAEAVDLLQAGRLALALHDPVRAETAFRRALASATRAVDRSWALAGLADVAQERRRFEDALKAARDALAAQDTARADIALAEALVRLGRAAEATDAYEAALKVDPLDERAHYALGNGYAKRNYTELQRDCGAAFAPAEETVRRGAQAFVAGDSATARRLGLEALRACPGYGRAHHLVAKALESARLAIDVHHAAYERRFREAPMPDIPGIEQYVVNWADLSPRHRKRVALSVAPWRAFIPVLVAGGETLFIKPISMRLSQTPGLETLKDTRIGYDSRLWDDVRGAGGRHTVTGIEDVEATISDRYNTVLHELSHQVHAVLPADDQRAVQALYREAKTRDGATSHGFLSRYAGGSIFEYFAEGANALLSPRRDPYDGREIVRERLAGIDPALQSFMDGLMKRRDVRASLPISLVNGASEDLNEGRVAQAMGLLERALAVAPDDPLVQASAIGVRSVHGDAAEAERLAVRALAQHPDDAPVRAAAALARWQAGAPYARVVAGLGAGLERLGVDERVTVEQAMGDYALSAGDTARALASFERVLAAQADSPEGLAGKAEALALDGRRDEAFALFERLVRIRSGEIDVRLAYARHLMLAGRVDDAKVQLAAAATLDAADPVLLGYQGWVALRAGDAAGARRLAEAALAVAPWCDTAVALEGAALRAQGEAERARATMAPLVARLEGPPSRAWARRTDKPEWLRVHQLAAAERRVIDALQAAPAGDAAGAAYIQTR
jgi:tetratricopeptide (TPR) repeat protein